MSLSCVTGVLSRSAIPQYAGVAEDTEPLVDNMETGFDKLCRQGGGDTFVGIALEGSVRINDTTWSTPVLRAGVCNVDWAHGYVPPLTHVAVSDEGVLQISPTRNIAYVLNMLDHHRVELFVRSHMPAAAPVTVTSTTTVAKSTIPEAMVYLIRGALSVTDFKLKWSNEVSTIKQNIFRKIFKMRVSWETMVKFSKDGSRWTAPPSNTYKSQNQDALNRPALGLPQIHQGCWFKSKKNTDPADKRKYKNNPPPLLCDPSGNPLNVEGILAHRLEQPTVFLKTDVLMYMRHKVPGFRDDQYVLFDCAGDTAQANVLEQPFALDLPEPLYNWIHETGHSEKLDELYEEYRQKYLEDSVNFSLEYLSVNQDMLEPMATGVCI